MPATDEEGSPRTAGCPWSAGVHEHGHAAVALDLEVVRVMVVAVALQVMSNLGGV